MKRGSITLYLCLTLSLLLSLISVSIHSAQISAGRVVLASALEQGMFSLFGEYDAELFERYGLLFLDGGRGTDTLQLGKLTDEVEDFASYLLQPDQGTLGAPGSLLDFGEAHAEMDSYLLATDGDGAAFSEQICKAMTAAAPKLAAEAGKEKIESGLEEIKDQDNVMQRFDLERAGELADQAKTGQVTEEDGATVETDFSQADRDAAANVSIDPGYENPIDSVKAVKQSGILALAVPGNQPVSGARLEPESSVSERTLERGVGVGGTKADGLIGRALMNEYALQFFPCFTSPGDEEGLRYQVEYLICQKDSDEENLKGTIHRLIGIREASNFVFLSKDPAKRAETLAAATTICAALAVPFLAEAVAMAIRGAWAYAESISDVRILLGGGSVPLVKTAASWKLSVQQLPQFQSNLGEVSGAGKNQSGLTYDQYLRMLIGMKTSTQLIFGMMDMVEHTMQTAGGEPGFRLDHCIEGVGMELHAEIGGRELIGSEYYRYQEE